MRTAACSAAASPLLLATPQGTGQIWVARASDASGSDAAPQLGFEPWGPGSAHELAPLLAALHDAELGHYPLGHAVAQAHRHALNRPQQRMAVVRDARQRALGLASLQCWDESAELLSWVVSPSQRGQGWGAALLQALEREALRQRQHLLRVQVAAAQQAAQRLLERAGFERCGPFLGRRADPFTVYFEKLLGQEPAPRLGKP